MPCNPFAVCVLPEPAKNAARTAQFGSYIHEILGQAGLWYESVSVDELADALAGDGGLRLLLTVGGAALPSEAAARLEAWVAGGGAWLSVAGVCGMEALLGVDAVPPAYVLWA